MSSLSGTISAEQCDSETRYEVPDIKLLGFITLILKLKKFRSWWNSRGRKYDIHATDIDVAILKVIAPKLSHQNTRLFFDGVGTGLSWIFKYLDTSIKNRH